ncbi:tyrosine-type recombinase/integrase [Acuticoccus sp. M5D2P5]|uniref:tyrosine-type recombinase/integrase n=1 Tax=Acuticoccus kalidii TaxID=2910977 RepID=UPI001F1CA9EA|nr:tyrosine-type recombinase/integrase [Acuticoccus kalidii]MCF3934303.1 tyrosine-type recombinase/integrase [Acuticoccus kalidii]
METAVSQRSKGSRLWLRRQRGARSLYYIKDGDHRESTGCGPDDLRGAEQALARYVATKHARQARDRRDAPIDEVPIADILLGYWQAKQDLTARPHELRARLHRLTKWWGDWSVNDINPDQCASYVASRGSEAGARRELEDLRAAVGHAFTHRRISQLVPVTLPKRGAARERWLTRDEMATLLWACWRYREDQKGTPGRHTRRHVARFILMARYTGTRASAICNASLWPETGRGWVDLTNGVFYRASAMEKPTNKRKPTIRLPAPLIAHIRSWVVSAQRRGRPMRYVVEWNGQPVKSTKQAFARARTAARLGSDVTQHTLRHTAITWAMQNGADKWEVSGFFGVSLPVVERVYGHHSENHQSTVHRAIGRPAKRD